MADHQAKRARVQERSVTRTVTWYIPNPHTGAVGKGFPFEVGPHVDCEESVKKFVMDVRLNFGIEESDMLFKYDQSQGTCESFVIPSIDIDKGNIDKIHEAHVHLSDGGQSSGTTAGTLVVDILDSSRPMSTDAAVLAPAYFKAEWTNKNQPGEKAISLHTRQAFTVTGSWRKEPSARVRCTVDFNVYETDADGTRVPRDTAGIEIEPRQLVFDSGAPIVERTQTVWVTVDQRPGGKGTYDIVSTCAIDGNCSSVCVVGAKGGLAPASISFDSIAEAAAGGADVLRRDVALTIFSSSVRCKQDGEATIPRSLQDQAWTALRSGSLIVAMEDMKVDDAKRRELIGMVHSLSKGFAGKCVQPHLKLLLIDSGAEKKTVRKRFTLANDNAKIGVTETSDGNVMIVVAAKRGDTDQQHLHCYFFEARVWDYTKELVLKFGSGVVVFDLDSTIIFEGREVRNGWGRFCEKVFRNTAAEGGEHTSFKIYLCTRTTGDPQLMWDRELAPKSGVKGAPALTLSGIQHYRWVRGQRWERKQLTDVLTVHMVERHCVVIFDDKGLELEIASGAVANPGAILKDNWHPDCADSLFKVLPFNGYLKPDHPPPLTPWRDTRDQVRTEDCALMNHGTRLKDSQKLFVKQLGDVGCRVLASAEELTTELRTLDSFMSARVKDNAVDLAGHLAASP
eukprot:m.417015 g.417015  ORF g.417015 m.417015 type:complete len:680 (+) comp30223_c0_seq1:65-2104(+)